VTTVAFVVANVAYLAVLDARTVVDSHTLAIDYGWAVGGKWGAGLFAVGVAVATIGSVNGYVISMY
jgi:hypothetical protein